MTAPVFSPPKPPSDRTTSSRQPRVLATPFGDGYRQRTVAGLHADLATVTLVWMGLSRAQVQTIEAFVAARKGVEAFSYTLPWEDAPRLWVCPKWDHAFDKPNALFTLDLQEVPA